MVEKVMDELDVKLYYEDSYIESFETTVISCEQADDRFEVVLSETAFFPEGGGQYADTGMLDDSVNVLDVRERDGVIYHITDGPLEVGRTVTGRINFEERFDKMQQHTAEHIVSGIVNSVFGYNNVGFHLGNDVVTMDYDGEFTEKELREIERIANEAVADNVVVESRILYGEEADELNYRSKIELEGAIRIVIIPGYDVCACCAPHVRTTGEIGIIKITGFEKYKGGMRISMLCGFRALADYNAREKSVKDISVLLSAKPDEVTEAVVKLKEQLGNEKAKVSKFMAAYVESKLSGVTADDNFVWLCEDDLPANLLRNYVNGAMECTGGLCVAMSGNDEAGYNYVMGSKSYDVVALSKGLNEEFSGKGGGKPPMVQGSLKGNAGAIREFLLAHV